MSRAVNVYKYDYGDLVQRLMNIEEIDNRIELEEILDCFGSKINGHYIIVNNEFYEDYNPYSNLASYLDKHFGCDFSLREILKERQELIGHQTIMQAEEELWDS